MQYVLDTSALIRAWNQTYRIRNFPDFWTGLEQLANENRLTVPDAVLLELNEQGSDLHAWCKDRQELLIGESSDEIQAVIEYIENDYPGLKTASMPEGKNFADSFVIATAVILDAVVVSNEEYTGNISGPRIPDVCKAMGIQHIMVHRIVVEEGWTFKFS